VPGGAGGVTSADRIDEAVDATRRTRLANERTYLAWLRSGLTAFAVGLGAGKLVPELSGARAWPYQIVGAGFGLLGVAFVLYGVRRQRLVERALARGGYDPLANRVALWLAAAGAALGLATVILVLVEP
jgi:putative membrane protein